MNTDKNGTLVFTFIQPYKVSLGRETGATHLRTRTEFFQQRK